jgi:hypothetical protein
MLSTRFLATTNFDGDSFIIAVLRVFRFKTLSGFDMAHRATGNAPSARIIRAAGHAVKISAGGNLVLQNPGFVILDRKILNLPASFNIFLKLCFGAMKIAIH